MPKEQTVFKRIEKKYIISETQYNSIIGTLKSQTSPDKHRESTIFSLYFDTPDNLLIRRSAEKPLYKEKLRLRAYGVPLHDSPVYLEIKKKFRKTVYKRRAEMTLDDALSFIETGIIPAGYSSQQQIINELAWFLQFYKNLAPSILISYDRTAYYGIRDNNLRITFDNNIKWRDRQHSPTEGAWGTYLLPEGFRIMEIKTQEAMPLWLSHLLNNAEIYPTSFSKVKTAYHQKHSGGNINYA